MAEETNTAKRTLAFKIGIGIIIASLFVWLVPIITPFTSLATPTKASIIAGSIIVAEIMFWLGALLAGKEIAGKIKSYFNPKNWRKKGTGEKEKYE